MAQSDVKSCREIQVSNKWSLMPGVDPTVTQTGWSNTNKTANPAANRAHDCNGALADVMDSFAQLMDDLIAKGIISA